MTVKAALEKGRELKIWNEKMEKCLFVKNYRTKQF